MRVTYVTGANAEYFAMACALSYSFQTYCPDEKLYVCDFGLLPNQRAFLRSQGVLLEMPDHLGPDTHPFVFKASLECFVQPLSPDAVAWIDSDCLVMAPVADAFGAILSRMGERDFLAVCPNVAESSIDGFLRNFDAEPFADWVATLGIDRQEVYLNSGVFLLRCDGFLSTWRRRTEETTPHAVFEQNAFNVTAYTLPLHRLELDSRVWNAHHHYLKDIDAQDNEAGVRRFYCDQKQVAIVHATASLPGLIECRNCTLEVGGKVLKGYFKLFSNPALQRVQRSAISGFVTAYMEEMVAFDLLQSTGESVHV